MTIWTESKMNKQVFEMMNEESTVHYWLATIQLGERSSTIVTND